MRTARVEAFSDGVFAVAITLLVLDLQPRLSKGSLISTLADSWPSFAAFAISFAVIGIIWVNHHAVFDRIARADRTLLFLNLGLLLTVVLIPFVTALFALYLASGGDQARVAGALFNSELALMGLMFTAVDARIGALAVLQGHARQRVTTAQRVRFSIGPFVYVACIGLSFFSPVLTLALDGAVAVYYVADQVASRDTVAISGP